MDTVVERLDDMGMPAWITLMVVSFVLFWPVGLLVLGYLIWSGRMGSWRSNRGCGGKWSERNSVRRQARHIRRRSSGNVAFDEYREETLRRLEEEQIEFTNFLDKLRMAKDKAEFEQFMADRKTNPSQPTASENRDNGENNGSVPQTG